jgi:hypothetical protein
VTEEQPTPVPGTGDVDVAPDGGHDFTAAGGSAGAANATALDLASHGAAPHGPAPAPRRRRRAVLAWSLSIAGVLLLAGLGAVLQLTANLGYDQAHTQLTAALTKQSDEASRNERVRAVDDESARAAEVLLGVTDPALVTDADRAGLTTARDRAQKASAAAMSLTATPVSEPGAKPSWFWELYSRTARLDADAHAVSSLASALGRSSEELGSATGAIDEKGLAVVKAAGGLAAQIESENVPSPNEGVLTLRELSAQLVATTSFDEPAAQGFRHYAATVQEVRDGHTATLAAEAGPLQGARQQIEDFARSLVPGSVRDDPAVQLRRGGMAGRFQQGAGGARGRPCDRDEVPVDGRQHRLGLGRGMGDRLGHRHGIHGSRQRHGGVRPAAGLGRAAVDGVPLRGRNPERSIPHPRLPP